MLLLVGGAAAYPACGGRESDSNESDGAAGEDGSPPESGAADATNEGAGPVDGSFDTRSDSAVSDAAADAASEAESASDASADTGPESDGGLDADVDAATTDGDAGQVVTGCPPTGSNVLVLLFSAYPQLRQVGAAVQITASGYSDPICGQSNIVVIQAAPGQFVALSSSCTHACCTVSYVASVLHCPCHGVDFNLQGQVVKGTQVTTTALPVLATCWDANGVYVTL